MNAGKKILIGLAVLVGIVILFGAATGGLACAECDLKTGAVLDIDITE